MHVQRVHARDAPPVDDRFDEQVLLAPELPEDAQPLAFAGRVERGAELAIPEPLQVVWSLPPQTGSEGPTLISNRHGLAHSHLHT